VPPKGQGGLAKNSLSVCSEYDSEQREVILPKGGDFLKKRPALVKRFLNRPARAAGSIRLRLWTMKKFFFTTLPAPCQLRVPRFPKLPRIAIKE